MSDLAVAGIGYGVVSLSAILFLGKTALDFMLPYGLIHAGPGRTFSWFWFVELVPLTLAVLVAWLTGLEGWFSPVFLGVTGVCLIGATFLHLFLVLAIYGFIRSMRRGPGRSEEFP